MLMDSLPIAVLMQRQKIDHPWSDACWSAVGVMADKGGLPALQTVSETEDQLQYLVSGLRLDLYPDENDGYFENWVAPEPKVFVMWRMEQSRAMPVVATVSYGEGTRMLDSGDAADGVPMPVDVYAWLADYLQAHYQPRPRRGREHG